VCECGCFNAFRFVVRPIPAVDFVLRGVSFVCRTFVGWKRNEILKRGKSFSENLVEMKNTSIIQDVEITGKISGLFRENFLIKTFDCWYSFAFCFFFPIFMTFPGKFFDQNI
jgi:hypothetical protein